MKREIKTKTILERNMRKCVLSNPEIKTYKKLLTKVGEYLHKDDPKTFAEDNLGNFSKMLREGEPDGRNMNKEFIAPIEIILNVSFDRLKNDENIEFSNIALTKSFKHYAVADNPNWYQELNDARSIFDELIVRNSDEYDKYLLDYLVEYQAINGIRYLVSQFGFHYDFTENEYLLTDDFKTRMLHNVGKDQISQLIIGKGDIQLFKKVYGDIFETTIKDFNSYLLNSNYLLKKDYFVSQLMHNQELFSELFKKTKKVLSPKINYGIVDQNEVTVPLVNPLLVVCLNYGLDHIDEFCEQVKDLIEGGICHNNIAKKELNSYLPQCHIDKYGFVCLGQEIIGNMIVPSKFNTGNSLIDEMLSKLLETVKDIRIQSNLKK